MRPYSPRTEELSSSRAKTASATRTCCSVGVVLGGCGAGASTMGGNGGPSLGGMFASKPESSSDMTVPPEEQQIFLLLNTIPKIKPCPHPRLDPPRRNSFPKPPTLREWS